MKKIHYLSFLIFVTASFWMISCETGNELTLPGQHFASIEEVRAMYKGEPVTIGREGDREFFIGGIVISNAGQGNNPEGKIIIQNQANGRLRGLALAVDSYLDRYKVGDSVIVRIDGKVLERIDGVFQISGLSPLEIGRISENNEQHVHLETDDFSVLASGVDIYQNTLVRLISADVPGVVRNQVFGDGDVTLSDGSNTVLVKTRETAVVANEPVPIEGDFTGILSYTATGEPYLAIRTSADIDGEYMAPEFYTNFPEGFEVAPPFLSGSWVLTSAARNTGATVHLKRGAAALITQGTAPTTESIIAMDFDLLFGASRFSLYYGQVTTSNNDSNGSKVYVEYSQDEGATWTLLEPSSVKYTLDQEQTWTQVTLPVDDPAALVLEAMTAPNSPDNPGRQRLYFAEYENLAIEGPVRFRIRKPIGTASRIMVDDVFVKPHE